ncbi:Holliday junction branch migration protein RuvA [Rubrobacter naiadicus]|uniref:Holliday junction branch migration protein RuvA n=1 Tax=Rubrobacter naiadicus TaxID=1392641 RepID=UPI00235EB830|nr:Holliday junction branch migration protein RuvA [Rubrobacter naiadicus]
MIERLRGRLIERDDSGVVVEVGGVGYRVLVSRSSLRELPELGEECVLHTRMVVREDAITLFGFAGSDERGAFDALTSVSKVGPKLALAVLSALSPEELAEAVARGDVIRLSSVPGLGKKTAERLVLELRGREFAACGATVDGGASSGRHRGPFMEAREALVGLGYTLEEAEEALSGVPQQDTVEGYVREALRRIGSRR